MFPGMMSSSSTSASSEELSDYDFVEKPSEDFFCPVTLEVLREPFLTVCCGNHLSQEAANRLQEDQKPCPLCKEPLQAVPDKYFKRRVGELKVRCSKTSAGCEWVGGLDGLDQHLSNGLVEGECQYVPVVCPDLCGGRVLRRDLEGHKATDCPKRRFACTHCGFEATYQEIVEDHWPKCSKYPLECPNDCGERDIERQDLPDHLDVCPLEVIQCEFDYAGCKEKAQRREMQFHVERSVKNHLQMVAMHAKIQEKQIEALTAQVHLLVTALQCSSSNRSLNYLSPLSHLAFFPPPVFTMTNFEQHKSDDNQWFSPPFYSYIGGYKMCISVYANGSDTGKGTHVSVYLHMMAGEYDNDLKWPFHGEVTVQLLNQRNNLNHWEDALIENGDYSSNDCKECFARVQGMHQCGREWGYPEFIPHEGLGYDVDKDCQYLKNDCLKFQVNKVEVFDKL